MTGPHEAIADVVGDSPWGPPAPEAHPTYTASALGAWHPPAEPGDDPRTCLATAASRAAAASVVMCVQVVPWLVVVAGGVALRSVEGTFAVEGATAAAEREVLAYELAALGLFSGLALVIPAYVLLGLWTSWTARAERSALGPHAAPRSKRAWWGWFVPFANVVLPFHAYSDAAMYLREAEHGVRKVPVRLACWWTGLCLAVLVLRFSDNGSALGSDRGYEGAIYLLSGVLGVGSSMLGALAFRDVAAASRRIVAGRSRTAGPASPVTSSAAQPPRPDGASADSSIRSEAT